MRALQVDRLQRRRDLAAAETGRHNESSAGGQAPDLADGCKGLSSGSPLPMGFHSSKSVHCSVWGSSDGGWGEATMMGGGEGQL